MPIHPLVSDQELASITAFAQNLLSSESELQPESFPIHAWQKLAEGLNALGWSTDSTYSGRGYSVPETCHRLVALGLGCKNNGLLFALSTQIWGIQKAITQFGNQEQKSHYLPQIISGNLIGAHAINETTSGSDALNISCTANKDGDYYTLNGEKTYIALATVAHFAIVYATTDASLGHWGISAFLVDTDVSGCAVIASENMMGLQSAPVGKIKLENCQVPATALLGKVGSGASMFNYVQLWERTLLLAPQIGTMKRQLDQCIQFSKNQIRAGKPISKNQSVSNRIADMTLRLNASELILEASAQRLEEGKQDNLHAALTKIQISESFEANSRDALTLFGAHGYSGKYEHEQNLRDAIGSSIYGGTTDLQKNIIAGMLGL